MIKFISTTCALLLLPACDFIPERLRLTSPAPVGSETVSPETEASETVAIDPMNGGDVVPEVATTPAFSGTASTIAGLGDPTRSGLWMETPLVTTKQTARVRSASGAEIILTLRPIAGEASAGSRLSIDAMRALGAPLTELITLQVSAAS